jgi:hypothetical protein
MSDALLKVTFKDGYRLFGLYHGTSDIAYENLFDTEDEPWIYRRHKDEKYKELTKTREAINPETVEIHSYYGGGFSWEGKACRIAKVITQGCDPYPEEEYYSA